MPGSEPAAPVRVIGIGASAGGLAALKTLFANAPPDGEAAYVVALHLMPGQRSHLAELIQAHTPLEVVEVRSSTRLQPNRVYIIAPELRLDAVDTHLRLSPLEGCRCEPAPIDHLLCTLAEARGDEAVAVILTGAGSDGALGVTHIKQHGGLSVVQDPAEAEFSAMPASALATGAVDLSLSLAAIPRVLLAIARARPQLELPHEGEELDAPVRELLQQVLREVRAQTGRDFSHYKSTTLVRRVVRRMQLRQVEDPGAYLDLLRSDASEAGALADELLLSVSSFFRDREVFDRLEREVLPRLFDSKQPGDEVRVWSVGCAGGEEAYSLAMLLLEESARRDGAVTVQVFASDLHPRALARARHGLFSPALRERVGLQRLRHFFTDQGGGYRVKTELREAVVFSVHDLLHDPPFSRLDLISCRNLLIDLERELQRELLGLFHYALEPGGYLVLGSSERVEGGELFEVVDEGLGVFRRRDVASPQLRLQVFPSAESRALRRAASREPGRASTYARVHEHIREQYAPPSVLVGQDDEIVHFAAHRSSCLVHPRGAPTTKIFKLIRAELRVGLRATLACARELVRAGEAQARARSEPTRLRVGATQLEVVIEILHSALPEHEGFMLVVFIERELSDEPSADETRARAEHEQAMLVEHERMRRQLGTVIEEYELSQEKLAVSNEELRSINEELRSTLEELETSKEELQSTNEELQTVNRENRSKVEELGQLSSDLHNLFISTNIATLFLDRQLRIVRFTPSLANLFHVRVIDRGRPIAELTHRLNYDELLSDAERVFERLGPVEREVRDDEGRTYLTRVLPYRGSDDRIEGVVLTFFDITVRVRTQEALQRYREQYQRLFQAMHEGFCVLAFGEGPGAGEELRFVAANPAFAEQVGVEAVVGKAVDEIFPGDTDTWMAVYDKAVHGGAPQRFERSVAETGCTLELNAFHTADAEGRRLAVLCQDISARKKWEQALHNKRRQLADELDVMTRLHRLIARLVAAPTVLAALEEVLAATMEITQADMGTVRLREPHSGALELVAQRGFEPEVLRALAEATVEEGSASARALRSKERVVVRDIEEPSYAGFRKLAETAGYRSLQSTPLVSRDGEVLGVLSTHYRRSFEPSESDLRLLDLYTRPAIDHLERSRSELAIRHSEARFRAMFEVVGVAAWEIACTDWRVLEVNATFVKMLGSSRDALVGRTVLELTHADDRERMERGLERLRSGEIGTFHTELRFLQVNGANFWGFVAISGVPGSSTCVALMFDVSRRREVERSLAEQSQRKDEFLALLGHELRNPLAAIQSATELVGFSMEGEATLQQAHAVLRRQAEHMARLVDGLVDVSRIERNKVQLQPEVLNLCRVLEEILADRVEAIEGRGLTLSRVLPDEPIWVSGDPTRLTQIFDNLLGNASKFTAAPGVITVRLFEEAGAATVRIKDTGKGIRPDMLDSIFEPFRQESRGSSSSAGLGLGLALARGLVELHHGTIEARSGGHGEGAEFIVQLPTIELPADTGAERESNASTGTPPLDILLAEDNRDTASMLAEVLRLRGHEVSIARDGRRALDLLREHGADVVLCDIGLPGMSGYDFARAVRADSTLAHTSLIAYTGYGQTEDRRKSIAAGFDAHLTKPVDLSRLEDTLAGLALRAEPGEG